MRILVCNTFGRLLGGVESYLDRLIPALAESRHEVGMLFEHDLPAAHPRLTIPGHVWLVSEVGTAQALRGLREWRPDLIFTHGINDASLEQALIEAAPGVVFVHDYSATCISGSKTLAFPHAKGCSCRFGPLCLVKYFPRRCGGISPIAMWRNYQTRVGRLQLLRSYGRLIVASQAMHDEYLRHGFATRRIELAPYPVTRAEPASGSGVNVRSSKARQIDRGSPARLLFASRMVWLKGGQVLLKALPSTAWRLQRPLKLTMAGEGPMRAEWQAQARTLCAQNPSITVEFTGWLKRADLNKLFDAHDLLVVPSLWPEPFGMVGVEAGTAWLPAAGFGVGGIPEWLRDGVNGFVATANPPSADALAEVIEKCLADPSLYRRLCKGARREAMKFTLSRHVAKLLEIFDQVITEAKAIKRSEAATESRAERSAAG